MNSSLNKPKNWPSADPSVRQCFAFPSAVLTSLPALAVAPQPVQAKAPSPGLPVGLETGEQRTWLYLEEIANSLLSSVQQLKALIDHAKQASQAGQEALVTQDKASSERKEVRAALFNCDLNSMAMPIAIYLYCTFTTVTMMSYPKCFTISNIKK